MKIYKSIDEYIADFPKEAQDKMIEIRSIVKETAPDAEETMSYKMPTFKLNGKYLIYFAAWKNHIALYPFPSATEAFKEDLEKYKHSKGTIQFPLDQDLPLELIRKVIKFRVGENTDKK